MLFHENCLLADNSHEISYLIFFRKLGKMSQNVSSDAVVIGSLRAKESLVYKGLPVNGVFHLKRGLCKLTAHVFLLQIVRLFLLRVL